MARDYFDESKKKKKKETTQVQKVAKSPSVSQTNKNVNKKASNSTFMGGGSAVRNTEKTVSKGTTNKSQSFSSNNQPVKRQPTGRFSSARPQQAAQRSSVSRPNASTRTTPSQNRRTGLNSQYTADERNALREQRLQQQEELKSTQKKIQSSISAKVIQDQQKHYSNDAEKREAAWKQRQQEAAHMASSKSLIKEHDIVGKSATDIVRGSADKKSRVADPFIENITTKEERDKAAKKNREKYQTNHEDMQKTAAGRIVSNAPERIITREKRILEETGAGLADMGDFLNVGKANPNGRLSQDMGNLLPDREESRKQAQKTYSELIKARDKNEQKLAALTKGAKGFEKAYYGAEESGQGMLSDYIMSSATGGMWEIPLALRTYGAQRGKAEAEGATTTEDRLNAAKDSVIEVVTEKIGGFMGAAKLAPGKKLLKPLADRIDNRLAKMLEGKLSRDVISGIGRWGRNVGEEYLEEVVANPAENYFENAIFRNRLQAEREAENDAYFADLGSSINNYLLENPDEVERYIAEINSSETRDEFIQNFKEGGMNDKQAADVADKMIDFMEAAAKNDTETMKAIKESLDDDLVGNVTKQVWDWNEQLETLASTALLMGVSGAPGAVSTVQQGMAIKNSPHGREKIMKALNKVAAFDGENSVKSQALLDSMEKDGYEPTATQVYDIMAEESRVMAESRERQLAAQRVKEKGVQREDLRVSVAEENPDGTYSITGAVTAQKYMQRYTDTLELLNAIDSSSHQSESDKAQNAAIATAVASYDAGTLSVADIAELTKDKPGARYVFQQMTGVDLDQYNVYKNGELDIAASNINMQKGLLAKSAQNYIESAREEQMYWNDTTRGQMADDLGRTFNSTGDIAIHDALESVDPRDQSKFMLMGRVAQDVYRYAYNTTDTWDEVKNRFGKMYKSLNMDVLEGMYESAKQDRAEQDTPYLNYEVKAGEALDAVKNGQAKPVIKGKFVNETPYNIETGEGRSLTESDRIVLASLAKGINANITMIDAQDDRLSYTDENGNTQYNNASVDLATGEILLSNSVDIGTAIHEITHVGARLASRYYRDLADYIFDKAYKHDPEKTMRILNAYRRTYADQNLSDAKLKEEVVSDLVAAFQDDPRFVRDISQDNPSLIRKIINAIEDLLRSLRNILATGRIQDPAVQNTFLAEIGAYEDARQMWLKMYHEAQQNNAALGIAQWHENAIRDNRTANARHTNVEQAEKERELFFRDSEGNGLTERQAQILRDISPDIRFSRPTFLNDLAKGEYYAGLNNGTGGFAGLKEIASGKDILIRTMQNNGFSENQTNAVVGFLTHMADYLDSDELQMRYSFIGWQDLTNAEITVRRDKDDNIIGVAVSAMVANGEYPVNFDMTTICNKREGVMEVIQELTRKYDADTGRTILNSIQLTDEKMWNINKALKAEGIDTACLGCFVEARRYYTNRFIDKIDDVWNSAVRDARKKLGLPEEEYFNFAKGKKVSGEDYNKISDLWTAYDESTEAKRSPAQRIKILMDEIVRNKEVDSPYLKLISAEDILTPEGIDGFKRISTKDRDMVKMIKSIYGTSAPKEILAFTPYNSEIALLPDKIKGKDAGEYLRSIGGTRVQSFSDFKMAHMFDHMQMVADEAARGFVNHGYSKVIAYPRLFGLTGRKINMSVMFDVLPASEWQAVLGCSEEAAKEVAKRYQGLQFVKELPEWYGVEGHEKNDNRPYIETEIEGVHGYLTYLVSDADYVNSVFDELYQQNLAAGMDENTARREANKAKPFEQSINYREAVALENQEGYKENVGIIAVAYGDEHLKMLLDDPNVRYVIPYHRSGLPVFIAQKTALDIARDYTDSQNTRKAKRGMWYDKDGTKFNLKARYKNFKAEYEQEEHPEGSFPAIEFFKEISQLTFDNPVLTEEEINEKLNEYIQTLPEDISEEQKNELIKKRRKKLKKKDTSLAGTGSFDVYKNLDKVSDIREISNAYLEHCINKNQVPIFYDFASHPNYYKMLFDFAVTDAEGNIYPQRPVRNVYPGLDIDAKVAAGEEITDEDYAEFYKAIEEGLQTENAKNELRSNRLGKVLDEDLLSREGENSIIADSNVQHIVNGTPDYTDPKSSDVANSRDVDLDEDGLVIRNGNARWTDDRIDRLIRENGASNPDYSRAYAVLMNPRDFLKLTLNDEMLNRWNEGANDPEHPEVYSLNEDELKDNTQTPFLIIHSDDGGEVFGHEGRHRMRALMEAGVTSIPVVINDNDTKYSKQHLDSYTLTAQDFGYDPVNNGATVTISDLVPIKSSNRDELIQKFGGEADVQFSRRVNLDDEYMAAVNSGNMDEAQRLVDEAAKMAGYTERVYHGTGEYFNVFRLGREGIHLGNIEQAEQVARNRYHDRSRETRYKWGEIKDRISEMDTETRQSLINRLERTSAHAPIFDGDISDAELVKAYAEDALQKYYGTQTDINNKSVLMRTFDRNVGENVMRMYARLDNPFVINGDILDWTSWNIANTLLHKADGDTEYRDDFTERRIDISGSDLNLGKWTRKAVEQIANGEVKGDEAWRLLDGVLEQAGGYHGIKYLNQFEGDKNSYSYIALNRNDVKLADPITYAEDGSVIPLSERFDPTNNDIRYSRPTIDAEGNILTDGQMEYFKNSQARDSQGRLVPVYHTTNKGGFTIFDPMRSDDHRSLFFADDWDTSQTYGNYANSRFYYFDIDNIDDVKKYLDAYSPDRYFVTQKQFDQAGGWEADMLDFENVTNGEQSDFAKYLDNPDGYIAIIGVPDYSPDNTSYADTWVMAKSPDELVRELHNHFGWQRDNYRMGTQHGYYACYLNLEDPYIIDAHGDNWNEIHLDDYDDDVTFDTREIAEMAMDMDFDGVIIRNLVDHGGMSPYDGMFDYSDIYIAFSSNQVKDINNENPTENPDIRYSRVVEDEAMSNAAHDYAYDNSYEALAYYEQYIEQMSEEDLNDGFIGHPMQRLMDRLSKYGETDEAARRGKNKYKYRQTYKIDNEEEFMNEFYAGLTRYADGMKFDDPVLEEGRTRMAKSRQDFFNSNITKWNQSWVTDGEVLKIESIRKPVRDLVMSIMSESNTNKKYKSDLVKTTLMNMRFAYMYAQRGRTDIADALLWHTALRMIDGVEFYEEDGNFETYKSLRDFFKNTNISLGEEYWSDTDYAAFRKANYGRLNLVRGNTNVDKVLGELYEEKEDGTLGGLAPEWFSPEAFENNNLKFDSVPDQLLQMAAVLDTVEPYAKAYSSEYCAEWATDIASSLLDIMQNQGEALVSKSDRYEQKIKAMKARHAEAMLKVRQQRDEGIKREKIRLKEYVEKKKEQQAHGILFDRIVKTHKKLTDRLTSNTADSNIPEQYKKELARLLAAFDLQTVGSKKYEARTGRRGKKSIRLAEIKAVLNNIESNSGEFFMNDAITDIIDDLLGKDIGNGHNRSIEGLTIDELNSSELARIDKLLRALLHEFNTYRNVKIGVKRQQVADIGHAQTTSALEHAKIFGAGKDYRGILGVIDKIINMDELTPSYLFRRIDPNKEGMWLMYEQLEDSHDRYIRNTQQLTKWVEEIVGEYHHNGIINKSAGVLDDWRSENYSQTFLLESGETISLTPAQMMSIYCLNNRAQAKSHMINGGVVVAPVSYNAKILSDLKKRANTALPKALTDADISKIITSLSEEQINVAQKLQKLMSEKMAAWGNEASMNVLGIELFGEPDYFPIKSDKAGLISDLSEDQFVEAIRSFGFTKAVKPGAGNAIMVNDIFDVVVEHCNNMNLYNAYSEAINDFMKVFNYKEKREEGTYTVKQAIAHAYSQKATSYIMSFMKDLNGNVSGGKNTGINDAFNMFLANAKKASVFANIRVAAQQPTAIGRVFQVIDPKYAAAMTKPEKGVLKEMFDHCPIALWKSWGYYDINMGRNIEDVIMNNNNFIEDVATKAYGELDNMTWGGIWQMVKAETEDKHPDVDKGSDEYWDLCNRRMREVVAFTQVVDSPFHRSHAMRSKNFMDKLATAFGAEPTLTFNMVRDGYVRAVEMWKTGDKAGATKLFTRTMTVFGFSAALTAAAAALPDVLRGKDPGADDDDDEKRTIFERWWANTLANFKDNINLLNNIYYVKDVKSILEGWEINNLGLQGWKYIGLAMQQLSGSKYARSKDPWWKNLFYGMGYLTGVPVKTIMTDFGSMFNKAKAITGIETPLLDSYLASLSDISFKKDDSSTDASMGSLFKGSTAEAANEEVSVPTKESLPDNLSDEQKDEIIKSAERRAGKAKSAEEQEKRDYDTMLYDAMKASTGYQGEEFNKKIWQSVSKGYTERLAHGDYFYIDQMRKVVEDAGGDVDYFDQRVFEKSKSEFKKKMVSDLSPEESWNMEKQKHYLTTHGMTDEQLSSEIVYKSDMAKDLKVAFRINDEEAIKETSDALALAGLTRQDYERIYKNRNHIDLTKYDGKYKDKLKSTGTFIWPTNGTITSYFGYRNAPTKGASSNHPAIDIGAPMGTEVVAADGGVVIYVGQNGGYGKSVGIRHDNGMVTYYNHLSAWNVNEGDTVAQGQPIANVGSTGISTGPHLDFKVLDASGEPVDPLKYLENKRS